MAKGEIIVQDIKRLQDKIQEIYFLGQFDIAKQYEQKLFSIRGKFLNISKSSNSLFGVNENEGSIIREIVEIEYQIDEFLRDKGKEIEGMLYKSKVNDMISNIDRTSTQELWDQLNSIISEWNQNPHSEMEKYEMTTTVAQVALKIYERQIRNGEEINLNKINGFCSEEDLLEAIQERLIDLAQGQEEKDKRDTLDMAKELTLENMNNPLLWQRLANVQNVKITSLERIQEPEKSINQNEQSTMALDIVRPKITLFERIKKFWGVEEKGVAIYTFGKYNHETGKWKNDKVITGKFPKYLTKKQKNKLIAIEIRNVPYVSAERGFKGEYKNLQKIKFGAGIEEIGPLGMGSSISSVSSLKEVIIDEGVEIIGNKAFWGTGIEEIDIPDSVRKIERQAFSYCSGLRKVNLGQGVEIIGNKAFYKTGIKKINIPDSVRTIGASAFSECYGLREVNLGQGVEIIRNEAFSRTRIKEIEIPDSVWGIGDSTFSKCSDLREVNLGQGVEIIGNKAFSETGIEKIEIPDSVRTIGASAFSECSGLREVNLGQGVEIIGNEAFYSAGIEKIEIPDSVRAIGDSTFSKCSDLREVNLGQGVETISREAFYSTGIEKIKIPDNVRKIEQQAFSDCSDLREVNLGQGVKTIEMRAFGSCRKLEEIDMGKKVKIIGSHAFADTGIKTITIPESVQEIGQNAFDQKCTLIRQDSNDDEKETKLNLTVKTIGKATINTPVENKIQAEQAEKAEKIKIVKEKPKEGDKLIDGK